MSFLFYVKSPEPNWILDAPPADALVATPCSVLPYPYNDQTQVSLHIRTGIPGVDDTLGDEYPHIRHYEPLIRIIREDIEMTGQFVACIADGIAMVLYLYLKQRAQRKQWLCSDNDLARWALRPFDDDYPRWIFEHYKPDGEFFKIRKDNNKMVCAFSERWTRGGRPEGIPVWKTSVRMYVEDDRKLGQFELRRDPGVPEFVPAGQPEVATEPYHVKAEKEARKFAAMMTTQKTWLEEEGHRITLLRWFSEEEEEEREGEGSGPRSNLLQFMTASGRLVKVS